MTHNILSFVGRAEAARSIPNKLPKTFFLTSNLAFGSNFNISSENKSLLNPGTEMKQLFREFLMHHNHQTERNKGDIEIFSSSS